MREFGGFLSTNREVDFQGWVSGGEFSVKGQVLFVSGGQRSFLWPFSRNHPPRSCGFAVFKDNSRNMRM